MSDEDQAAMNTIAREWLEARDVIVRLLRELLPEMSFANLEHNAAACIARLSHAGFAITKTD